MTAPLRPLARARIAAAMLAALSLAACSIFTRTDTPPRTSVSLTGPSSIERPEWLHKEVARMDAEAFGGGEPLKLKLSYFLAPVGQVAMVF